MTIQNSIPRIVFNCDGHSTSFPVNLQAYLAADFEVVLTSASGAQSLLVLGTDYQMVTAGSLSPPYWTLTTLAGAPYATGNTLQIFLNPTQSQLTQYVEGQEFPSEALQQNMDRLTQMVQRLQDEVSRAIAAPDGDINPLMTLPGAKSRAGGSIVFDANGNTTVQVITQGQPGQNAITFTVNNPALQVAANSAGVVSDFSAANGLCTVYNGSTNITQSCALSVQSAVNCTATVNTTANTPVNGQPVGYYTVSAMSANIGVVTLQAIYQGVTYIALFTISKSIAGGAGSAGTVLTLSNPAATVQAYANGNVLSFAGISGNATMTAAGVDVTAATTWSAVASGLTGTINTAVNTPVNGQAAGFYQVTAMSQTIGTLTITGVYGGQSITQVFLVTQVPIGFEIVTSLPVTNLFQGRVVFLTADNQLYRYSGSAWTTVVPAVNITGTITTTQIATGSITTPLLAANSVTAAKIAANTITAAQILANTITGNQIAAGTITAAKMAVTTLSSLTANLGTITAGNIIIPAGAGYIQFNNGVNMKVTGTGFGAGSAFLEWYGPTQSSAGNFSACTTANGLWWLKTDGTSYMGGRINVGTSLAGSNGYYKHPPDASGRVFIDQWFVYTQSGSSPDTVSYPTPFPNACLNVQATNGTSMQNMFVSLGSLGTSSFTWNFGVGGAVVYFRAWGY